MENNVVMKKKYNRSEKSSEKNGIDVPFFVSIDNRHDNTIALYYYPIAHGEKCDYSDIEIVLLGFWTDIRPTDRRPAIENLDLEDSTLKKMYNG